MSHVSHQVRTLADSRDPDMLEDDECDDEGGGDRGPSLLDQCQAQMASILRIALDKSHSSPPLTICACNVSYELLLRGVHSDPAAVERPIVLLLQMLITRGALRDVTYSHVASATVQISVLCTLARVCCSVLQCDAV